MPRFPCPSRSTGTSMVAILHKWQGTKMITNDMIRDAYADNIDKWTFDGFVALFPPVSRDDVRRRTPRIIRDFEKRHGIILPKMAGMPELRKTGSSKLLALAKPAPDKQDSPEDVDSI